MCVQMSTSLLYNVAGLMTINRPQTYSSRINIANANITALKSNGASSLTSPQASLGFTNGNLQFTYFAKSSASNLDFWEDVVSAHYGTGFRAETWGRPYQPAFCTPAYKYQVLNTLTILLDKYTWKNTNDHSKWGLTLTGNVLCYADINRMDSQKSRGGGGLCVSSTALFNAHSSIIATQDKCAAMSLKEFLLNFKKAYIKMSLLVL